MPRGRRLDIQAPVSMDFAIMTANIKKFNTRCESPKCHPDASPAFIHHQTAWSFCYLCQPCWEEVNFLTGGMLVAWEVALAEHMWELMMRRAYPHMNVKSGFVLEEMLEIRVENERKLATLADKERAAEQRDLRRQIRESSTKIGAPDDELLVARERQDLRKQMGMPTLGRERVDRTSILRSKLIIPSISSTDKEGE